MQNLYGHLSLLELLEIVLSGDGRSDEVMWYLLHERLSDALKVKYNIYKVKLCDAYEDNLNDFFLYLREGSGARIGRTYRSLHNIKRKDAFGNWLISAWRNFLCERISKQELMYADSNAIENCNDDEIPDALLLSEEQKGFYISRLIAYSHQVFLPRGRFILFRTLLTALNKPLALPTKDVAKALDMTEINYRVANHRLNVNVRHFFRRQLHGEELRLDEYHQMMANDIYQNMDDLYVVLARYYGDTLRTLKQHEAIMMLRESSITPDGVMCHESGRIYKLGSRALWNRIQRLSYSA